MKYTENLNMLKPDKDDKYLVDHMNSNTDILDAAFVESKTYSDTKAAEALASAKSYAAVQDEETLTTANGHADGKAAEALQSAKSYADTKSSDALASAKSYCDEVKEEITGDMGSSFKVKTVTIPSTGWEEVSHTPYYAIYIDDVDVTADSVVNVNLHISSISIAEECELQPVTLSLDGRYMLHALAVPSEDMDATVTIQKEV